MSYEPGISQAVLVPPADLPKIVTLLLFPPTDSISSLTHFKENIWSKEADIGYSLADRQAVRLVEKSQSTQSIVHGDHLVATTQQRPRLALGIPWYWGIGANSLSRFKTLLPIWLDTA
jgi:hypothetical protein